MTETSPAVQVRTYKAKDQSGANELFQQDANVLGGQGYRPTNQIWVGASKARIFLTPLILLIPGYLIGGIYGVAIAAVIGVVYILVASMQARGTLSVTYTR
jgi:hypothetical protein